MPPGRAIHIHAIVKKYKALPLYLPECKNTIAAGTCQFNKEMLRGNRELLNTHARLRPLCCSQGPIRQQEGQGEVCACLQKPLNFTQLNAKSLSYLF